MEVCNFYQRPITSVLSDKQQQIPKYPAQENFASGVNQINNPFWMNNEPQKLAFENSEVQLANICPSKQISQSNTSNVDFKSFMNPQPQSQFGNVQPNLSQFGQSTLYFSNDQPQFGKFEQSSTNIQKSLSQTSIGNFEFSRTTNVPLINQTLSNIGNYSSQSTNIPLINSTSINNTVQLSASYFGPYSTNASTTNVPIQQSQSHFGFQPSTGSINQMPSSNILSNVPINQQGQQGGYWIDYFQLCQSNVVLTPSHIAARHTMEKKLPRFFGEPKKWQIFESAFVTATINNGLNNADNLSRLQDCLKGDALETVQCQLLHPNSVPGVMNTLRMMYGRPEMIINKLLEDAKQTPSPKADDLGSLVKFAISVQNLCATVQYYNAMEHLRNPMLIKALTDKLPAQIQLNWAFYKQTVGDTNLSTLGNWLYQLANVATDVVLPSTNSSNIKKAKKDYYDSLKKSNSDNYVNAHSVTKPSKSQKNIASVQESKNSVPVQESKKCPACNNYSCKLLATCSKFKELSLMDKWNVVKTNKLCGGCFGPHIYYRCRTKKKCGIRGCQFNHHVLLHNESKENNTNASSKKDSPINDEKTCNAQKTKPTNSRLPDIFRIVPVILSHKGKSIRIYAYLDDGSNLTSLEQEVAQKINAGGTLEPLCILWSFGETQIEKDSKWVSVQIEGVFNGAEKYTLTDVRTVTKLQLPMQSITSNWLNQYSYFKGIPINTYENAVPQMIIGLQYSKLMVSLETIEGDWTQPLVCRTRLGWVVQGPTDTNMQGNFRQFRLNMCDCQSLDNNLQQLVKEFFSFESFGVKMSDKLLESKDISRARKILESSTVNIGNRYETSLLWRNDTFALPDSFLMARRRLECVESRMKKDPVLANRLCNYFADFIDKGYIRKLSSSEQYNKSSRTWYLPIFPVFNPKKPEKLRVVWDAAAKVQGKSLNSMILVGPDQLVPLPDILRRFRERKIGITGDIKEMFHQILVRENDQDSQRFLWRDGDSTKEPDVYVMQVLTFGSSCSPCIAQFVKNKNAIEFKDEFPRAVEAITNGHYVDDLIESAHTVADAVKLVKEVQYIHQHAGFELRNFISNSQEVLQTINGNDHCGNKVLDDKVNYSTERVLGMYWNTASDTFTYSLKFLKINVQSADYMATKREILRTVMSVFDPLGFLAHYLIHAKILIQEIWRTSVGWDDQLPMSLQKKWIMWLEYLPQVEEIHIPRLLSKRMSPEPAKSIQLHMFVDASMEAYAAVAYFRIENEFGVDSCLVGAKSKVAPNKPISVPRLELQGGVLGTRLAESILKSHNGLLIDKTIIWCDSKTVLFWLNSDPRRYHQFVAFRVGEILDTSGHIEWRWIPSEYNVADEATKSKNIPNLNSSSRWFVGPEFLRDNDSNWFFELDEPNFQTQEEVRTYYLLAHLEIPLPKFIEFERFSNWQRLLRATAYVLRFVSNSKLYQRDRCFGLLSQEELRQAENTLYRQVQYNCFKEEILILRWNETALIDNQKDFDKTSVLRTLSPYLDEHGVLRVMGRIDDATSIADSVKRPIILSRKHYVTKLIVYWYHRKYLHLHHQTVLNEVKQKYWIPKLRVVLNEVRNNCQKCKNTASVPKIPEMAQLPPARLAVFTRVFTFVGVDYFGPILVVVNRGTQKRWGVLFTCLTTRAIHLEIAHSLNTDSCIMSVENFMFKRGLAKEFYSDNGTNFHGTHNELISLRAEFAKLDQKQVQEKFTTLDLTWKFNPPKASHMGGIWERMVRIVKTCLDETMTTRYPTDEVLKNLFAAVENIVNSRPLTYVSLDSIDDEVLTPNHFLIGSSNGIKPPGEFTDQDLLRNTWRTAQAMSNKFWQKFVLEYIPTLTRRSKWFKKVDPLEVGDVVIVCDEKFQQNTWPKAIVVETYPDKTGQVRRAKVQTATGTVFTRPTATLAKLDVKDTREQEVKMPNNQEVNLSSSNQLTGGRMLGNTV